MKKYEVMYADANNVLQVKTVEAENSTEARKSVSKEEGKVVKATQIGAVRKAISYEVAVIVVVDGIPEMRIYQEALNGVSSTAKFAHAKAVADAMKKHPDVYGYYVFNISDIM